MKMKVVFIHGDKLLVSSFSREVVVDRSNILKVEDLSILIPTILYVKIYFREATDFGEDIIFIPPLNFSKYLHFHKPHPVVKELDDWLNSKPNVTALSG